MVKRMSKAWHPHTWPTPWTGLNQTAVTEYLLRGVCVLSALQAHCAPCGPERQVLSMSSSTAFHQGSGWGFPLTLKLTIWLDFASPMDSCVCMLLLPCLPCWAFQADIEMSGIGHPNSSPHVCRGKALKANSPDPLLLFLKSFLLVYINTTY